MDEHKTQISEAGQIPTVEIVIGQAQFGKYQIYLWDSEGKNPRLIGEGLNTDNEPDIFPIGPPSELGNKMLSWQAIVTAPSSSPGQKYSVIVTIRQGDTSCPDSPFQQKGPLSGTKIVQDYTRLVVK